MDGDMLPTLQGDNLTVAVDMIANNSYYTVEGAGSAATIVGAPIYACNVSLTERFKGTQQLGWPVTVAVSACHHSMVVATGWSRSQETED